MPLTLADRAVLAMANLWVWCRHPYLSAAFWWRRRRPPLFATPRGVSELVQWRKIFDRNPLFPVLADKLAVKSWAHAKLPGLRTAEVLWTGTRAADLPNELIRDDVVIKTNHGTRTNWFPGREKLARADADARLDGWLARRFDRELQWAYGKISPRLMVERLVGDGKPLWELTFRCCDGRPATAFVAVGQRTSGERSAYFTGDGVRLPPKSGLSDSEQLPADFALPPVFWDAREIACRLSAGLDYVRVDLMVHEGEVYLCEMTLYPGSGFSDEHRTHTAGRIERAWVSALGKSWFLNQLHRWPVSIYAAALRRWAAERAALLAATPLTPAEQPVAPAPAMPPEQQGPAQ